jgi:hypothetical protein
MNTRKEIEQAVEDYQNGTFIKRRGASDGQLSR